MTKRIENDNFLKTDYNDCEERKKSKTIYPNIFTEHSTRIETKYSGKFTNNSLKFSKVRNISIKETQKNNVDLIDKEIEHMNLKEILNNVDPSFDCQEILSQLYDYENAITNEIKALKYQFKSEESYMKDIKEKDKNYKFLSKPIVYDYLTELRMNKDDSNESYKQTTKSTKNINDQISNSSKVKINCKSFTNLLHNEIACLDHNINDIKFENNNLSKKIEEMRKNYIYKFNKLKDLADEYNMYNDTNLKLKENNYKINIQRSKYISLIYFR